MDYDGVLEKIGGWGSYQKTRCAIMCIAAALFGPFGHFALVVMLLTPPYWCKTHDDWFDSNQSALNMSKVGVVFPDHNIENPLELNYCKRPLNQPKSLEHCLDSGKWDYDLEQTGNTLVTDYSLVCDEHWYVGLALMLYTIGDAFGVLTLPFFMDNLGRKLTFFVGMGVHIAAGSLGVMVPSLTGFLIFRLINSMAPTFIYVNLFVWSLELVIPEKRSLVANGSQVCFSVGIAIVGVIGFLCKNWVYFGLMTTLPLVVFVVVNALWLDESVRWMLLKKNKTEKVRKSIRRIVKVNKSDVEIEDLWAFMAEKGMFSRCGDEKRQVRLLAILINQNLSSKLLALCTLYIICNLSYFTLQFNVENLPGNPYLMFSVSALIEIPAVIINLFMVERFGHIPVTALLFLVGGVSSILTGFFPDVDGNFWTVILLALFSKGCLTATYITTMQLASEHFPTEARGTGLGFCALVSHLTKVVMPLIKETSAVYQMMPLMIIGSSSIIAGLVCLLLPETRGVSLPQTFEEAYMIGSVGFDSFLTNIGCNRKGFLRKNTTAAIRLLRLSSTDSQRSDDFNVESAENVEEEVDFNVD